MKGNEDITHLLKAVTISYDELPIVVKFKTREAQIKEYVLMTGSKQDSIWLNKREIFIVDKKL